MYKIFIYIKKKKNKNKKGKEKEKIKIDILEFLFLFHRGHCHYSSVIQKIRHFYVYKHIKIDKNITSAEIDK